MTGTSRRSFLITAGSAAAIAALRPRVAVVAAEFPSELATLYRKSIVIDTQCRPFASADSLPDKAAIQGVQQSGITAINFTVSGLSFEETIQRLAFVDALVEQLR